MPVKREGPAGGDALRVGDAPPLRLSRPRSVGDGRKSEDERARRREHVGRVEVDAAVVQVAADADAGRVGSARQSDGRRAVTDMDAMRAVVHADMGRAGAAREAVRERGCSWTRTGSVDPVSSRGPACGTVTPPSLTAGYDTCPGWIPAPRPPPR